MESPTPAPDREGFGEASLGDAQSSNPPSDPEMIDDHEDASGPEPDAERQDPDNEPSLTADQVEGDAERDEAEGSL